MKAIEQTRLTDRERDVVRESLERAYDRAEFLLTPDLMQALAEERTEGEEEDADAAALVSYP